MMEKVCLQIVAQSIFIPMQCRCLMDIESTFFQSICLGKNLTVMSKTNREEINRVGGKH